ncbi:MAG TPA: HD domain-containing protein [Bacteroidales bacterium]|nr:HD domain-containing protein [Bacteroidales bacterium]
MIEEDILRQAETYAMDTMRNYDSSHDWQHVLRVRRYARYINAIEQTANPFLLDLVAILHDTADKKFHKADDAYVYLADFLIRLGLHSESEKIIFIIRNVSFSSSGNERCNYPELKILQDADRLDAIGAIGVARAFSYGGFRNNSIHDPLSPGRETTIKHFYDKLLKIRDLMNTKTGRQLAEERHNFIQLFLNQFLDEWNLG